MQILKTGNGQKGYFLSSNRKVWVQWPPLKLDFVYWVAFLDTNSHLDTGNCDALIMWNKIYFFQSFDPHWPHSRQVKHKLVPIENQQEHSGIIRGLFRLKEDHICHRNAVLTLLWNFEKPEIDPKAYFRSFNRKTLLQWPPLKLHFVY